jgi:hypothetical protein
MASNVKDQGVRLQTIVADLTADYERARNLYDKAGLDANLKENALQAMANAMQLQNVAIQNYANWKHVLREDFKIYNKKK